MPDRRTDIRILLADASPRVRAAVKRVLVEAGHRVTSVDDGARAAAHVHRDPPDLLVTGIELPHVRGPELARVARSARARRPLACIFLVPAADPRPVDPGPHGAVLHLPFTASALRETAEALVAGALEACPPTEVPVAPPRTAWSRGLDEAGRAGARPPEAPPAAPLPAIDVDLDAPEADEGEPAEPPFEAVSSPDDPAGRIVAEGRLAERPLGTLLVGAMESSFTGVLVITRGEVEKRIHLRHGRPVYCESNLLVETLGEYLVERRLIAPEDQARAGRRMRETGVHAGEALVELGLVTAPQLADAMHAHVRDKVVSCFAWEDAGWRLEVAPPEEQRVLAVEMEPLLLVADGVRRYTPPQALLAFVDEGRARHLVPSPGLFRHAGALAALPGGRALARLLDGRRTLDALLRESGLDELLGAQLVLTLVQSGLARLSEHPAAAPAEVAPDDELIAETASLLPSAAAQILEAAELSAEEAAIRRQVLELYIALPHVDHHALLGVEPGADAGAIARAFAEKVGLVGPDRLAGFPDPEVVRMGREVYVRLIRAYDLLRDPRRREGAARLSARHEAEREARRLHLAADERYREGRALLELERPEEAEAKFREAGALNRKEPVYAMYAGWAGWLAAREAGDARAMDRGEAQVRRALEVLPILDDGYVFLARMAEGRGDAKAARTLLERALLFDPGNAEARALHLRIAAAEAGDAPP